MIDCLKVIGSSMHIRWFIVSLTSPTLLAIMLNMLKLKWQIDNHLFDFTSSGSKLVTNSNSIHSNRIPYVDAALSIDF